MCYAIFIASPEPLEKEDPVIDNSVKREAISEEVRAYVQPKMNFSNLYQVVSDKGCACALHQGTIIDDIGPMLSEDFIHWLARHMQAEGLEIYACWYEDWHLPVIHYTETSLNDLQSPETFMGLKERHKVVIR